MLSLNLAPVNKISVTSHTKNLSKQYLELPSISKIKHNMTIIWCSMRISSKTSWCYKPLQCTKYIFPFKAKFTCNDAVKYVPNILDNFLTNALCTEWWTLCSCKDCAIIVFHQVNKSSFKISLLWNWKNAGRPKRFLSEVPTANF